MLANEDTVCLVAYSHMNGHEPRETYKRELLAVEIGRQAAPAWPRFADQDQRAVHG